MNKQKIQITKIVNHGKHHELWCDKHLMLRTARKVGDIEIVNHYVLGVLNAHKSEVEYKKIN